MYWLHSHLVSVLKGFDPGSFTVLVATNSSPNSHHQYLSSGPVNKYFYMSKETWYRTIELIRSLCPRDGISCEDLRADAPNESVEIHMGFSCDGYHVPWQSSPSIEPWFLLPETFFLLFKNKAYSLLYTLDNSSSLVNALGNRILQHVAMEINLK